MPGLIIAAPQSGSGKTLVTLGLLRHLRRRGVRVAAAKIGPDYIDPSFLAAACGEACPNLDPWAMRRETIGAQLAALEHGSDLVLCEGVMGLFDGAGVEAAGSTADLAALSGWPVILVVNLEGQGASVAALIDGFARHREHVRVAGVIFNRTGSARHAAMAHAAVERSLPAMKRLGALPREASLRLPSRHLGLVPAGEHQDLENFLDRAAALTAEHIDVDALIALAQPARRSAPAPMSLPLPPFGNLIAVARDDAFAFAYESVLEGWRAAGAALSFFSPLGGEGPSPQADAIYLPGGYPELFAARIAGNGAFMGGLREAAERGAAIYGECGGYMVLGEALIDADGVARPMAGLLPLTTSFAARKLHLGYRVATLAADGALGRKGQIFRGHEFHYATIAAEEGRATPLFEMGDADGTTLGTAGQCVGRVMGSFVHLIDRA
jgi:cobyrinic acid a,c-diamide synthase